jgi:hypothetical protein
MKVFLGGTCNKSTWRDELIPKLKGGFFNPVVEEWTEECQDEEILQREICNYCLYVITPEMTGLYSIAEVIDDSNKRPEKTLFCYIGSKSKIFTSHQAKSLQAIGEMVLSNGGQLFNTLDGVASFLNDKEGG